MNFSVYLSSIFFGENKKHFLSQFYLFYQTIHNKNSLTFMGIMKKKNKKKLWKKKINVEHINDKTRKLQRKKNWKWMTHTKNRSGSMWTCSGMSRTTATSPTSGYRPTKSGSRTCLCTIGQLLLWWPVFSPLGLLLAGFFPTV